jgi:hypothetical protein
MTDVERLRTILDGTPPGTIPEAAASMVESYLAGCWEELAGSGDGGMVGSKLRQRTEQLAWNPPLLTFRIERHGGTVNGSSRADLQYWEIDIDGAKASIITGGKRQLSPMDKRINAQQLATEVAAIIRDGREDARVSWRGRSAVVRTGAVIPATNKQTTAARRKRFSTELEKVLLADGWKRSGTGLAFEQAASEDEKS